MVTTKICTGCELELDLEAFHRHKTGKHGRHPRCKACRRGDGRAYHAANRERILERHRAYYLERRDDPAFQEPRRRWAEEHADELREYHRALYVKDREARREYGRRYHAENAEEIRARVRAWAAANPERVREGKRLYKQRHPEKVRQDVRRGSALRRTARAGTDMTAEQERAIFAAATHCPLCWHRMTETAGEHQKHLDHIHPVSRGGRHVRANVRIICAACNWSKHTRSDLELALERRFDPFLPF